MPVSKKKAEALVRKGGTMTAPARPQEQKPIQEGPLFSKQDIKEIMIEAMKIANANERRGTSRLTVNRDARGFISTVDITPIGAETPRLN